MSIRKLASCFVLSFAVMAAAGALAGSASLYVQDGLDFAAALCCAVMTGCDDLKVVVEEGGTTPAEAIALLRQRRAKGDSSHATVVVRGTVRISEPIVLGAADGEVTIRGECGAVVSGGCAITGWTDRGDGVWGAKLPTNADGKPIFTETLFVNGRRAQRSRYPADGGFFRVMSASQTVWQASVTGNRILLDVDASEPALKMLAATPKDELAFAQLLAHTKWDVSRTPIEDVSGNRIAVDAAPMKGWNRWSRDDFYALENVRAAFTEPGQWFYDAKAGEVLYRPLAGSTRVCTAPTFVRATRRRRRIPRMTRPLSSSSTWRHGALTTHRLSRRGRGWSTLISSSRSCTSTRKTRRTTSSRRPTTSLRLCRKHAR